MVKIQTRLMGMECKMKVPKHVRKHLTCWPSSGGPLFTQNESGEVALERERAV